MKEIVFLSCCKTLRLRGWLEDINMTSEYQEIVKLGRQLGHKGVALQDFVKEEMERQQQKEERLQQQEVEKQIREQERERREEERQKRQDELKKMETDIAEDKEEEAPPLLERETIPSTVSAKVSSAIGRLVAKICSDTDKLTSGHVSMQQKLPKGDDSLHLLLGKSILDDLDVMEAASIGQQHNDNVADNGDGGSMLDAEYTPPMKYTGVLFENDSFGDPTCRNNLMVTACKIPDEPQFELSFWLMKVGGDMSITDDDADDHQQALANAKSTQ